MADKNYTITFTHEGKKYDAAVQQTHYMKYPMIRVAVDPNAKTSQVFIFWVIADKKPPLYWHPMEAKKEAMAKSLIKKLQF